MNRMPARRSGKPARASRTAARQLAPGRMLRWECALFGLLVGLCGCPPPAEHGLAAPPRSRAEALDRVNSNLSQIDRPLRATGSVSFRFKDSEGKSHNVPGQDASLEFQPPRGLLFDVRALSGTVAEFGSTNARYWLWVDLSDFKKMWWGEWSRLGPGSERRLPIPPNELFDALMLRPLPAKSAEGGLQPLLRTAPRDDYRLLYIRLAAGGQPSGWREIRLDPRPPYQPVEIVDRTADGAVVMEAQLSNYTALEGGGPLTPHRYVVHWPANDAEMRLDIARAKFLSGEREPIEFPAGWKAERERVDAPAAPPPATQPAVRPPAPAASRPAPQPGRRAG